MEVVIGPSEELAVLAADAVQGVLLTRPRPVLGVATGSSPLSVYAELARRHVDEGLSFAHATAFLLDEYVGLPVDHPERYATVIGRDLASKVDLPVSAVHSPDGLATDLPEACRRYEEAITAAGGVDLQLLGIGTDGHVAFNEPTSSLASRTRIKTLTEQTRRDNSRFFGDDLDAVPHHVLTQGLGTIMQALHHLPDGLGLGRACGQHDDVAGLHDRAETLGQHMVRHGVEVVAEEPRVVPAGLFGQGLDPGAGR